MLNPNLKASIRSFLRSSLGRGISRLAYIGEYLVWGGELRERIMLALLAQHYGSRYRRQWVWSGSPPHFTDSHVGIFGFAFGKHSRGAWPLFRGFYSAEVIREGDKLLDIGCGDGFFANRFFAAKCAHIDAVDIEPSAIRLAKSYNRASNIAYQLLDAVNQPFPSSLYDVIVLDGAIGHLSPAATDKVLKKIFNSLAPEGIFVGSESLGKEGLDHLQAFDSLDDLALVFNQYFLHVEMRCVRYSIGQWGDFSRQEGYWRCSNSAARFNELKWGNYSAISDKVQC